MARQRKLIATLISLTITQHTISFAQDMDDDTDKSPDPLASSGYTWGSFLVKPEIAASLMHDSNIFATRTNEIDDTILLVSPSLAIDSNWDKHKLGFKAGATAANYRTNDDENYQDYWISVDGQRDLSEVTAVFGGLGYTADHEDRGSPDETLAGSEPTTFDSRHAHAGLAHRFGSFKVRMGGTFEALNYHDVDTLNNDDRDRTDIGLGARLSYRTSANHEVYIQAIRDERDYDYNTDDLGYQRDSDGSRLAVGFRSKFNNRLQGGAYVGRIHQEYEDSRFSTVNSPDFNGALSYRATPRTTVSASLERSLEETTLSGSSSYLYTQAGFKASHRIDSRTQAEAAISAGKADYQDISREDKLYSASTSLRYYLSPRVYVAASYRVLSRDSNIRTTVNNPANIQDTEDYARQQFFLTLGSLLYPVRGAPENFPASLDRFPATAMNWQGFYAGARIGHGTDNLRTSGIRGGSGIDQGEFGDESGSAGLFLGYGLDFNRWYAGIELEGEDSKGDIYHRKAKSGSRTQDVEIGNTMSIALRGGYHLVNGDLLYLKAGKARTDFKTYYTLNNALANAVDRTFTQHGVRYAIGSDIPAGDNLFVRMEYAYTQYDDYIVDIVTDAENFHAKSSHANLGLGWSFGGHNTDSTHYEPIDINGFYAGVHIGHGSLNSHLAGTHTDSGGGGGTSAFIGDFGNSSGITGGVFAGFGHDWNHWYLGIEAEAEDSTTDWNHLRDPNGRNFSVEKKNSHGLGLRGGYQLANGTLLYLKGGIVRTRFNTGWTKGNNRNADIDRDDTLSGKRYGFGVDMPASRTLLVRMDYSFTNYDGYDFTTSHANADSMTFDNSETLFRLGVGARF